MAKVMFSRAFERRIYVGVAVLFFSGSLAVSFGAYVLWPSRREAGYEPKQPIAFSHKLHAGELQIECLYCHSGAKKGPHAWVPPVSTCMNCHAEVQPKDEQGNVKAGIATLLKHWERDEPIRWNKVYDLADFAYFDHSRHVTAGVECQECHGPVEQRDTVRREYGLKMSWCLECHKQKLPDDDPAIEQGRTTRAPTNCTACHR